MVAALTFACGGSTKLSGPTATPDSNLGSGGSPSPPPGGSTLQLAWDQQASSPNELSQHTFVLYVDGTGGALQGATCGTSATPAGYICTAPLPALSDGTHTLQLSAVRNGVESTRSEPLPVTVQSGQAS